MSDTFNIQTEEGRNRVIQLMAELKKHPGWGYLVLEFQNMIEQCDEDINEIGKNEVIYSRKDLAILEKRYLKHLIAYPDELIYSMSKPEKTGEQQDPYKDFDLHDLDENIDFE